MDSSGSGYVPVVDRCVQGSRAQGCTKHNENAQLNGVDSASNRNKYQEYFLAGKGDRYVGLTTLPPSRADCLEIW